jgi:hypothetical protein
MLKELSNVFTWTNLYYSLKELTKIFEEHKDEISGEGLT